MQYCRQHLCQPSQTDPAALVQDDGGAARRKTYDKSFRSWDHLVMLTFAQLCGVESLRGLEAVWNAHSHHHYHLGTGPVARSTLSDANARRPIAIFAETLRRALRPYADHALKREGAEMLRLIDSTPIPARGGRALGRVEWAHARSQAPRRLRSHGRSPAAHRDHALDRQRCPGRQGGADRGGCNLCLRQGLLPLRMVDAGSRGPQHLRHAPQNQRHLQACSLARAQEEKGRRLYGPRRRQRQTRNPGPYQARHPDASRAREARGRYGHHPHHQRSHPLGRRDRRAL